MSTLSFYLIVAFFCYYKYSPKSKTDLWKYALLISLITTGIYLLYSFIAIDNINDFDNYKVGQAFSLAVIPMIISVFVIYFLFKKKLKNGGVTKFPIILVAFIIVTLGLGVYQSYVQEKLKKSIENVRPLLEKERETEKALKEINSVAEFLKPNLPITTEDGLILYDILFAEEEKFLAFFYQSIYDDVSDLTDEEISSYKTLWREQLLQTAINSKNKQAFITADVSMIYLLKDKNNKTILEFAIRPNEYKN